MARTLRFIIIPKVAHLWFDEVNKGAQTQAEILSSALGVEIVVDYRPPSICDVVEQNAILENAAKSHPSGIAVDPVDEVRLADDEFLMVYGANHGATGKATCMSVNVYASEDAKMSIG